MRVADLPFREAQCYWRAGGTCRKTCGLAISLADMQAVEPRITDDIFSVLSVENSVASRTSHGGTQIMCAPWSHIGATSWEMGHERLRDVFTALTLFAVLAALPACGKRGALKLPI